MLVKWKGEELAEYKGLPRVHEARMIKKWTGLDPMDFMQAAMSLDPDAFAAFVVIMHHRAGKLNKSGQVMRIQDVEGEFSDIEYVLDEEERRSQAEEESGVINPTIAGILEEFGIDVTDEQVREVVMRHLMAAQESEGNADAGSNGNRPDADVGALTISTP